MANCRICLRPEPEAGPLQDQICIDCERKLEAPESVTVLGPIVRQESQLDTVSNAAALDPTELVRDAIARGFTGEQLREVVAIVRDLQKDEAARAWARAVTGFQAEMPPITKTREANVKTRSGSDFSYRYASYDNVKKAAKPYLEKWGIATSFDTETATDGKRMRVTVHIRVGTHVESRKFDIPISAGQMSDAQSCGAALSYAKRYALCAALDIVVTDEDNDAASLDFITQTQVDEIIRILKKLGKTVNFQAFLDYAGIEATDPKAPQWGDLAKLPNTEHSRVMDELNRREAKFDAAQKGPQS